MDNFTLINYTLFPYDNRVLRDTAIIHNVCSFLPDSLWRVTIYCIVMIGISVLFDIFVFGFKRYMIYKIKKIFDPKYVKPFNYFPPLNQRVSVPIPLIFKKIETALVFFTYLGFTVLTFYVFFIFLSKKVLI